MGKSHGLMGDFVISFDIILSNGSKMENVTRSEELYWAVLGGGPGAYGVVTKFEMDLSQTSNDDYKGSVGFCYFFKYTKELMFVFGDLFVKINEDETNYLDNDNVATFTLSLIYDFETSEYVIKILWIWVGNGNEEKVEEEEKEYLSQLFLNGAKKLSIEPLKAMKTEMSISKLMIEMSQDYGDIAVMPYIIRSHAIQRNVDDEFIDLLIDRIELVHKNMAIKRNRE